MSRAAWIRNFLLGLGVALLLEGCAAIQRQEAKSTEDLLVAAGFRMRPADTPEKLAHLKAMPPFKLVTQSQNGQVIYAYADPGNCQCLYVGGPDEYTQYKRLALQQQVAQEKLMAAEMQEDASLNWGLWGPFWD